jgi:hypothetical protein
MEGCNLVAPGIESYFPWGRGVGIVVLMAVDVLEVEV